MRLSIWPSSQQPWSDVLEVVRHCDSTGWDGIYLADHFMADGDAADGTPRRRSRSGRRWVRSRR